jgi:hypothetical protein
MNEEREINHDAYRNADSYLGFELIQAKKTMRLAAFAMVDDLIEWRKRSSSRYDRPFLPIGYFNPRSLLRDDQITTEYKQYRENEEKRKLAHEILEIIDDQSREHLRAAMFRCQDWYDLKLRHPYQGPGPDMY